MKKSRYTEEQIIGILKQHEADVKTADLCREHGISAATFMVAKIGESPVHGGASSCHQQLRTQKIGFRCGPLGESWHSLSSRSDLPDCEIEQQGRTRISAFASHRLASMGTVRAHQTAHCGIEKGSLHQWSNPIWEIMNPEKRAKALDCDPQDREESFASTAGETVRCRSSRYPYLFTSPRPPVAAVGRQKRFSSES